MALLCSMSLPFLFIFLLIIILPTRKDEPCVSRSVEGRVCACSWTDFRKQPSPRSTWVLILWCVGLAQSVIFLLSDEWPGRWCSPEEDRQTLQLHVLDCTPASCWDVPCGAAGTWGRNDMSWAAVIRLWLSQNLSSQFQRSSRERKRLWNFRDKHFCLNLNSPGISF